MKTIKVISLIEPWATLIKEQKKYIETRSWRTNYRGELYIHASLKKLKDSDIAKYLNILETKELNRGFIIAKCQLVDCILMDEYFLKHIKQNKIEYMCGEYKIGRFAWILKDIVALDKPLPAKGQLGIWSYKIR